MSVMCFFFFKQKTAYEMRISDWSSDVCSSDLPGNRVPPSVPIPRALENAPESSTPKPQAASETMNMLTKIGRAEDQASETHTAPRPWRRGLLIGVPLAIQIGRAHV